MADQAKITSLDALERFRSNVIIFLTKAHQAVDEVSDEIRRTRQWLHNEQRSYWDLQYRKRAKILDEARQVLLGAKMSNLRESTAAQEVAVRKATHALHEADDKRRAVKQWNRNFDGYVGPLAKGIDGLRYFLDHDMPKALAFLVQAQKTLEDYADVRPTTERAAPPPIGDDAAAADNAEDDQS